MATPGRFGTWPKSAWASKYRFAGDLRIIGGEATGSGVDRDIVRQRRDPGQPGLDVGIVGEAVAAAFFRDMGIGVERDVGEAEGVANEPVAAGQMLVHQLQRGLAG